MKLFSATTEQYASKEECIKWLNEIGTFAKNFQDWKKIKATTYQNLDNFLLIKVTVKARAEKALLLYEFPFSLNPCDKSNDAQT